jgi:hypothetical protein
VALDAPALLPGVGGAAARLTWIWLELAVLTGVWVVRHPPSLPRSPGGGSRYGPVVERCEGCGFVYDDAPEMATAAATAIRRLAADTAAELLGADVDRVRRRPGPSSWSALEYVCHMRDVLLVQRERVLRARREDGAANPPMGRDERVEHDGYAAQDPQDVARQLGDAAALFAGVLDRLDAPAWQRTLVYNYPERATRSLRWVAVHTVHEIEHHLADVRAALLRP